MPRFSRSGVTMISWNNKRVALFALCLSAAALCVNGFILGRSRSTHRSLSKNSSPDVSLSRRTDQEVADARETYSSAVIYPADTLLSIGSIANSTQLAMAPDIAYFYLQNTIGLSEETMWKITLESESILGMTPRNLEKKVSLLRRTMNLSDDDVRAMLAKQPALLHYSAERNLAPTILFLVRALGLSKAELRAMVMDCPSILGYSMDNLKKKIAFFAALGYSDESEEDGMDWTRELLVGTPKLLLSAVDTGLVPRVKFMTNEMLFSLEELQVLYKKNPRLLMYSLDDNIRETIVFFFIIQLQIQPDAVRKILLSFPQVMDYSLENHIRPIAEYFMTELQFSAAELGAIVLKFPRVFSYSLFRIKHLTGFLRYELALDPRQTKRIIFQSPQLFGLAEGSIKEKLDFVKDRLGLNSEELGLVFSKMPTIMCVGVNTTLAPKVDYLEQSLLNENYPNNQLLKETILKQPTLLGYSLEGRIRPRMERLIAAGVPPTKISVGISMSEAKFQKWVASSASKKVTQSLVARRNSTASGFLHKDMHFNEEELNILSSELTDMNGWTTRSLRSWIGYLEREFCISGDPLKEILLSYPRLLDGSFRPDVKRRLNMLCKVDLPVQDYLDAIYMSDDEFRDLIQQQEKESGSKIAYLRTALALNETESRLLASEVPSLESAQANKLFRQYMDYLVAEIGGSIEATAQIVLARPSILGLSMKRTVEPRMVKIQSAGVSGPWQVSNLIAMDEDDFEANITLATVRNQFSDVCECLESTLKLNREDVDSILLSLATNQKAVSGVEDSLEYLMDLAGGDIERVKAAVQKEPQLLSLLPDELQSRAGERKSALRDTCEKNDMFSLATTSDEDFSLCVLQARLNFTDAEMDSLRAGSGWWRTSSTLGLAAKLDYLLTQGCQDDVQNAILSRPNLLSHPLKRLQQMTNVLVSKRQDNSMLRFGNESRAALHDVLHLSEQEVDRVLANSRYISLRDPEAFLVPKLHYLISKLDENARSCVLAKPALLDYSLHDWIMPRMNMLSDAGLDPSQIIHIQRIEPTIQYLKSQLTNPSDLKRVLQEEPKILTLSLEKKIRPRMEMILDFGCPATDISKVMSSRGNADVHCAKAYLSKRLRLPSSEIDAVFASIGSAGMPPSDLRETLEFLLQHAFGGSEAELKAATLKDPSLLLQSVADRLRPRLELLRHLEATGLTYQPDDVVNFFVQPDSKLTNELMPYIKTWYPLAIAPDEVEEPDVAGHSTKDSILAMLKDFVQAPALAYSDDPNRDVARVVHWR